MAWSYLLRGRQLRRLAEHFGSAAAAWRAPLSTLRPLGFPPQTVERLTAGRPALDPARLFEQVRTAGLATILATDDGYPAALRHCYDAPALLYCRGALPPADAANVAVVGTRRPSAYGQAVTLALVRELARAGVWVTSGLARGVDALAHEAAIEAGGRTVAVVGTGLLEADCYPREHRALARRIVETGGAVVSEYPPGVGPERHHFPERNQVIAGLTLGTLVTEAPATSGALITARAALDAGREVLAVPGSIFEPNAEGTNRLLKLGATPVTTAADVFDALQLAAVAVAPTPPAGSPAELAVLDALGSEPQHVDFVQQSTALDVAALAAALTTLEIRGLVRDTGGKRYIRI